MRPRRGARGAMKMLEKRCVKSAAKKLGFHVKGSFLIGVRSKDVISGLAIDAAPSAIYIWTFVLPAFDDVAFMHMALGERVIDLSSCEYPLEQALTNVWGSIHSIRDAGDIISYLETEEIVGEYAKWTRFICLARLGNFDQAEEMLGAVKDLRSAAIPRKLNELQHAKSFGGWPAVQKLLIEWSHRTDNLMSGIPSEV